MASKVSEPKEDLMKLFNIIAEHKECPPLLEQVDGILLNIIYIYRKFDLQRGGQNAIFGLYSMLCLWGILG